MTLSAEPAWNWQIEIRPDLIGSTLRETIDLRLIDDLRADHDGIDAQVRLCRMRAEPLDLDE